MPALSSVRWSRYSPYVPAPGSPIFMPPMALVVPLPAMVPPYQAVRPVTVSVPAPVSVPEVSVRPPPIVEAVASDSESPPMLMLVFEFVVRLLAASPSPLFRVTTPTEVRLMTASSDAVGTWLVPVLASSQLAATSQSPPVSLPTHVTIDSNVRSSIDSQPGRKVQDIARPRRRQSG